MCAILRWMASALHPVRCGNLTLRDGRAGVMTHLTKGRRCAPCHPTFISPALSNTTLADLFTLLFAANPFSAAGASLWRWSSDEFEDGLAHGGQCRSRRRPVDSFFPALLF